MVVSKIPPLSSTFFRGVAIFSLASSLFACVVEDRGHYYRDGDPSYGAPADAPPATTASPKPPASTAPMLVVVDTGQVMNADPGQGVGIFAEYAAGGRWHIWWTCDTAKSRLPCDVDLSAAVTTGFIEGVQADIPVGTTLTAPDPSRVQARTTTALEVHGITFTTTPGAIVTLEATVGGLREGPGTSGSFFFFVQRGQINGGYTGILTNPLQLQGSDP